MYTRMFVPILLIAMAFTMMTSIALFYGLTMVVNRLRDDVLLGVKNGMPLSLKHRRDITVDWALLYSIIAGGLAFVAFTFLTLARLSDDEGVRWLGYFAAASHAWGLLMTLVFAPLEALTLIKHLRAP